MNGAECLLRTLTAGGVNTCFMNPGTSEMQIVAAADRVEGMRCILGLFEGVVSGAADGYARFAPAPPSTLFHLGPGLANGLANLHNAMRARVPIVNIVGDQATYHRRYEAPLNSDIAAYAAPVSGWIGDVESAQVMAARATEALRAAMGPPRCIATLIVPANSAWEEGATPPGRLAIDSGYRAVRDEAVAGAAAVLRRGEPAVILLAGRALLDPGLEAAGRIARATGARLFCDTFVTRLQRGAGRVPVERLPYFPEAALEALGGARHLIIVGSQAPVSFFAYPGLPGELTPRDCATRVLAEPGDDGVDALQRLCDALDARDPPEVAALERPALPSGTFDADTMGLAIAALLPEATIVVDESVAAGLHLVPQTANAAPHDWLMSMGGAVGNGAPLAVGAAAACPDRRVLCLQGDGSAMYTLQALWTQAREGMDVTTVIFANRRYEILGFEHERLAGPIGPKAGDMFDLARPEINWVKLAGGMGVPAQRVSTTEAFNRALGACLQEPGPNLIEAII